MNENNELDLVKRYIEGDEQAFNLLAGNYQKQIYWLARRMTGNHLDADEITQEVLIVLYKKLKDFQFHSSLGTWIYKITSNRCISHLRKNKIRKFIFLDDPEAKELKMNDNLYKSVEDKEKLKKLDLILKKLPMKQKEVFILRRFNELSYEEISDITGNSVGGLKANYFHALKKVTELMEDEK